MKKVLLFASLLLLVALTFSCSKEDNEKYCWKFTVKQTTSISPSMSGYPKTVTSTTTQCDLTEDEAEDAAKKLTSTTTTSANGYKITVKTTVTKTRTDQEEEKETGHREPTGR